MRAVLLIIDSFGMGALPDAHLYGDEGANTARHICDAITAPKWPTLKQLGLGNCAELLGFTLKGCEAVDRPMAGFGVMAEASAGKDTTTGHWELAGIRLDQPFHTFSLDFPSFPEDLVQQFEDLTGHRMLGNKGASGTIIIEELGEAHMTGEGIIVYTSADSVFQVAAHEEIIPLDELYRICEISRQLCDPFHVGRVIARPFIGTPGNLTRTRNRKDYSMKPAGPTLLDHLQHHGVETVGVGKIGDIFVEQGLSLSYHDAGNEACLERTIKCMTEQTKKNRFIFVNLVDTDMLFGHRRDIQGYHDAVQAIDQTLGTLMDQMTREDLLIITADHGCDPGFKGTDHTREYVPLLVYARTGETGRPRAGNLGIRTSFCDVAQSLCAFFKVPALANGTSFI